MPLDLTKDLPEDDYVIFKVGEKEEKLYATADLPRNFVKKFSAVKEAKDDPEKAVDQIEEYLKDMFYLKNKKELVDRCIDNAGYTALIKVSNWYNDYVQSIMESDEKKN
jgi:dsDNA-specific endonuclease/ATPase MutS2